VSVLDYRDIRDQTDRVVSLLQDLATLLGATGGGTTTLETGGEIVPGLGFRSEAEALRQRASEIRLGVFKIIVLGEFKTGKSTLLNGMLGGKKLPAKATPATAIITVLVHGDSDQVAIHEEGKGEPRRISWEEFVRDFQLSHEDIETLDSEGSIDRFRQVEYAQVEVTHEICAGGVRFIDSPGLGEHLSRTRVALGFLKQSHAVIFVLNATRLLGPEEREFIEHTLGEGPLQNVFFAVNRVNQVNDSDLPQIRDWLQSRLGHHFVSGRGDFDPDLYSSRVHFVNAKGASEAATTGDEHLREASGVPALERELQSFLATGGRAAASFGSTVRLAEQMADAAVSRIATEKAALDQPLQDLQARFAGTEARLQSLQARRVDIERTIRLFGETIKQKVYGDLSRFVDRMRADWAQDSRTLIDLDKALSLRSVLSAYAQHEAREQLVASLSVEVQRYLQIKFGEWAEQIPAAIREDVESMMDEVEAQVEELQLELNRIASMFAGTDLSTTSVAAGGSLQQVLLSAGDIGSMTDNIMDMGDMSEVVGRLAQQAIAVLLVGTFLTGGNFLLAIVLVEAIHLGMHESEVKKRIREGLGEKLYENLREQVTARRPIIYETIGEQFDQFAASVTKAIAAQIDGVRSEHQRIIERKGQEQSSIDAEKDRLEAVGQKILELVHQLRTTVELQPQPISPAT
jgi:hypothetical protein